VRVALDEEEDAEKRAKARKRARELTVAHVTALKALAVHIRCGRIDTVRLLFGLPLLDHAVGRRSR